MSNKDTHKAAIVYGIICGRSNLAELVIRRFFCLRGYHVTPLVLSGGIEWTRDEKGPCAAAESDGPPGKFRPIHNSLPMWTRESNVSCDDKRYYASPTCPGPAHEFFFWLLRLL
jgi:hypothetical protein